ncbi:MAG: hypothetical protein AB7G80_03675 [Dongiaceae bacterium]
MDNIINEGLPENVLALAGFGAFFNQAEPARSRFFTFYYFPAHSGPDEQDSSLITAPAFRFGCYLVQIDQLGRLYGIRIKRNLSNKTIIELGQHLMDFGILPSFCRYVEMRKIRDHFVPESAEHQICRRFLECDNAARRDFLIHSIKAYCAGELAEQPENKKAMAYIADAGQLAALPLSYIPDFEPAGAKIYSKGGAQIIVLDEAKTGRNKCDWALLAVDRQGLIRPAMMRDITQTKRRDALEMAGLFAAQEPRAVLKGRYGVIEALPLETLVKRLPKDSDKRRPLLDLIHMGIEARQAWAQALLHQTPYPSESESMRRVRDSWRNWEREL